MLRTPDTAASEARLGEPRALGGAVLVLAGAIVFAVMGCARRTAPLSSAPAPTGAVDSGDHAEAPVGSGPRPAEPSSPAPTPTTPPEPPVAAPEPTKPRVRERLTASQEAALVRPRLLPRDTPLAVGATAPHFAGFPQRGKAVIVFFRGVW